jgi:uncharacterized repeat protein (TIGR03803 family)
MNNNAFSRLLLMRFMLAGAVGLSVGGLTLKQETLLYAFQGGADGANPQNGLTSDTEGALYGTVYGEVGSVSEVFQLTPPASGQTKWTKSVLATVVGSTQGSLTFGPQGSLYGVSSTAVFQLSPPANAQSTWTQTTLWSFGGGVDGGSPQGPLIFDTKGALYGVTQQGGTANAGTVFKLTPPENGQTAWRKTVLWIFAGGEDGAYPQGGLIFDHRGALYGTTLQGGTLGLGTVYQLTPPSSGLMTAWRKTVLYSFRGIPSGQLNGDGAYPHGSLIFDTKGSLYGTSDGGQGGQGSPSGFGTVYQLSPPIEGHTAWATPWRETVICRFSPTGLTPGLANGGLIFDTEGALYGTTTNYPVDGWVFKLSPPATGQTTWTLSGVTETDGAPNGGLVFAPGGSVYGTTITGGGSIVKPGQHGYGSVFKTHHPECVFTAIPMSAIRATIRHLITPHPNRKITGSNPKTRASSKAGLL